MPFALRSRDPGMGSGATLPYKTALVVIVFLALAVYNTLEIIVKIFRRFRRYHGVYFYSMLAASIGIIIHALGYFLRNFDISNSAPLEITLACGGGMLMITGQSIVLWSRLHLISPVDDYRRLHCRTGRGDDIVRRLEFAASCDLAQGVCEVGDLPSHLVRLPGMSHQWTVYLQDLHAHAIIGRLPWPRLQARFLPPDRCQHFSHLTRHHHTCLPVRGPLRDPNIMEDACV
jgi:hypothetical protein